ncbi:MAG: hypothetical protein JG782_294 [Anaerophaga sp.]|uniref:hypothetical protein n=1 Tax=Anaerophaga thermohalophila TaxID=177400 RepID=UPI00049294D1|nr:hypothetical protein [Anaerophaga thermohalophila]MBZ4675675.1 hypothetical protein [Anaerophaga sp.]MDI3520404.1 hypothetical protein [Anaerophaga sp.]MDK2840560.1 hypothetical protein [Anaerophaga sp.]MDN5290214.1 hypothetical protein [Anaerophaga sp.]
MLYRTLHNNSLLAFILVPFILLLFWVRVFLYDGSAPISFDGVSMPLWEWLVRPVFGQSNFWAAAFSYILALLTAFTVNRLVGRHGLLGRQSVLPAVLYGLLVSGFLIVQRLHVVWMFNLFFLLAIERIMGIVNKGRKEGRSFDAALLLGVGALMYAKGLYLYPLLLVVMGGLRLLNLRTFLASLMGLLLPFVLSAGYFFFFGKTMEFLVFILFNLLSNTGQFSHNLASRIYLLLISLPTLIGIVNVFRYLPTQKIITRKLFRVIVWLTLLTAGACLTPFFSVELAPVVAVGPSIVLAFWLDKISRRFWQETILLLFFAIAIAAQLYL